MLEKKLDAGGQQIAAVVHFAKERDNLDGQSAPIKFDRHGKLVSMKGKTQQSSSSTAAPSAKPLKLEVDSDLRDRVYNEVASKPRTADELLATIKVRRGELLYELNRLCAEGILERVRDGKKIVYKKTSGENS
jgi:DNA-binding transcriptional ArsR family regulator